MTTLIHHSIAKHAAERPDAIAFRCREKKLTYRELFQKSSQLANYMRSKRLRENDRVGIFMGKDISMPIAIYGTLTAGAAYVPIDPSSQESRLEFILQNCGIEILITTQSKIGLIKKIVAAAKTPLRIVIGLPENTIEGIETTPWEAIAASSSKAPELETQEDGLAYIMYTSGSTGTPKGMMHTHHSGLAYAQYSSALYNVLPSDVLGNHAPLHFDISTFEFLTGPYVGATSVLIPEEELMFPNNLAKLIAREQLTFWYSVPLALIQILTRSNLSKVDLTSLRWILFAGEPFPPKFLAELMEVIPTTAFSNIYGPAEVNQCTYYHIPRGDAFPNGPIPIGQTWDGADGIILDENDQPVSRGELGELVIHSATMMRNYWQRPDLDSKAFYYKTLESGDIRRYYRTGDLVKMDENGLLHFFGRKDRQIKIRGYRLELDEVEAVFTAQTEILEAVALVNVDSHNEKEIVVVAILQPNADFDPKKILVNARCKLPHYGLPNRIEILEAFPRTPTGKPDRTALANRFTSSNSNSSSQ